MQIALKNDFKYIYFIGIKLKQQGNTFVLLGIDTGDDWLKNFAFILIFNKYIDNYFHIGWWQGKWRWSCHF